MNIRTNHSRKKITIIGVASCFGAQDLRCANGPIALKQLNLREQLHDYGFDVQWDKNIYPEQYPIDKKENTALVLDTCKQLASQVHQTVIRGEQFVIIGGDHSCAIGTWSGVATGLGVGTEFGLIWIDAHMDSHTPDTSPSGAIHGMPLASLLGYGDPDFYNIAQIKPKIKPHNLCLVGIRSFEKDEEALLSNLGVKIFHMDDIHEIGLEEVLILAQAHVSKNTQYYGISIDLDAIDPIQAPGVGSPSTGGLNGKELVACLKKRDRSDRFLGIEITELNPDKDQQDKTAKLAIDIIQASLSFETFTWN